MTLKDVLSWLNSLEFSEHEGAMFTIIADEQKRLAKRRREAELKKKPEIHNPGEPSRLKGSLGADRE